MQAMVYERPGRPLVLRTVPRPEPGPAELLIEILACGVCRTDLHLVDGELPHPKVPVIPGHEIVGRVVAHGAGVQLPAIGTRVGVPWLGTTCGHCAFCESGRENLCAEAHFHRLSDRRRLRGVRGRRRALCIRAARPLRRAARGPAVVRRVDRLSRVFDDGRQPERLASTDSAPRRTSSRRSRWRRGAPSMRSPGRATSTPNTSRGVLASTGPAAATNSRRRRSMRR